MITFYNKTLNYTNQRHGFILKKLKIMDFFLIDSFSNSEATRRFQETAQWEVTNLTFLGAKPLRGQEQKTVGACPPKREL